MTIQGFPVQATESMSTQPIVSKVGRSKFVLESKWHCLVNQNREFQVSSIPHQRKRSYPKKSWTEEPGKACVQELEATHSSSCRRGTDWDPAALPLRQKEASYHKMGAWGPGEETCQRVDIQMELGCKQQSGSI
jgi:hypothetical protein